jgi:flagellin
MALTIQTNVASLGAQRQLNKTQHQQGVSLSRLSSGLRINSAADDAAGLAISEKMRAQVRGLAQAERNAMDGVSLIQTAEGAMNEVSGILTRMRELSVQSANGTLGSTERGFLNDEFSALRSEIDRIAKVTEFNGASLLEGSSTHVTFQVGTNNSTDDQIQVTLTNMQTSQLGGTTALSSLSISSVSGAQSAMTAIDSAISDVSSGRAKLGATQNRLQVTVTNLSSARENISAANSRIRDTDVAEESAALTRNSILMQAGVSILAQANQMPSMALSLLG